MFPAASTPTPCGWISPAIGFGRGTGVPSEVNLRTLPPVVFPAYTFHAASTAMPSGETAATPPHCVTNAPAAVNFSTREFCESATYTLPAESVATARGWLNWPAADPTAPHWPTSVGTAAAGAASASQDRTASAASFDTGGRTGTGRL